MCTDDYIFLNERSFFNNLCCTGVAGIRVTHCRWNGDFTLNACPVGKVIRVQSAEVGFNQFWLAQFAVCSWSYAHAECGQSIMTREAIRSCNGQRTCSISQSIFTFLPGSSWQCLAGNIVNIEYNCIPGAYFSLTYTTSDCCIFWNLFRVSKLID